jgi:hypothetical protein
MRGIPVPRPWRLPCGNARLLERLTANRIDNAIRHNIPGGHLGTQVTTTDGHPRRHPASFTLRDSSWLTR